MADVAEAITEATATELDLFERDVLALVAARGGVGRMPEPGPMSVSEQLEDGLKRLIQSGELPPGAPLVEVEIAARFGVSRAPVRDALRMLDKQGLVQLSRGRTAIVFRPDASDIADLYEVRAELFTLAGRKAAGGMDAQLRTLAERGLSLMDALAAAEGPVGPRYLMLRNRMSQLVLLAAHNRRLADAILAFSTQAFTHGKAFDSAAHRRHSARHWRGLIKAILDRDPDAAAAHARQLVVGSRDELLRLMRTSRAER